MKSVNYARSLTRESLGSPTNERTTVLTGYLILAIAPINVTNAGMLQTFTTAARPQPKALKSSVLCVKYV